MILVALAIKSIAGITSLICFILVLISFFQRDQGGLAIVCIIGIFVCGIGPLIAFVKGWMEGDLNNLMLIWTAAIGAGLATHFVLG